MERPSKRRNLTKLVVLAGVALLFVVGLTQFGGELRFEKLAEREGQLIQLHETYPVFIYVVAFVIYVAVAGLSIPGATVLTLLYGWYLGFWQTVVLVSFASTAGATLAFLFSRYLFRDSIQARFGERLQSFNESLAREGPFFLFTLRLIPAVPFFAINLMMGLTPIPTRTFWWVSQLGMLPGTAVYVYAGSTFPRLADLAEKGSAGIFTPQLWLAFGLLAVFPFIIRFLMSKFRSRTKLMTSPDN